MVQDEIDQFTPPAFIIVLARAGDCSAAWHFLPCRIERIIEMLWIERKAYLIGHRCVVMADRSVQVKQSADCVEKDRLNQSSQTSILEKSRASAGSKRIREQEAQLSEDMPTWMICAIIQ